MTRSTTGAAGKWQAVCDREVLGGGGVSSGSRASRCSPQQSWHVAWSLGWHGGRMWGAAAACCAVCVKLRNYKAVPARRDILLSLVPFVVSYAFKLISLRAALAFGIAWSAFLLLMRTSAYDSRRKEVRCMVGKLHPAESHHCVCCVWSRGKA